MGGRIYAFLRVLPLLGGRIYAFLRVLDLGVHFGVSLVTFSCFGPPNWQYGFQGRFFSDLGVDITPGSDARMC